MWPSTTKHRGRRLTAKGHGVLPVVGTPRTGKFAICSLPWRRCHRRRPARRRPPIFRSRLQVWQRAKFRVAPDPERCPAYTLPGSRIRLPNFLRQALSDPATARLTVVPACFVLQIQRQNANRYMPIEDTSIEWQTSDARLETVARINVPAQDFDTPRQNLTCDNLSFNPWHGIAAHRPIGGINRLRKAVYESVSERHSRNAEQRPTGPFLRQPLIREHHKGLPALGQSRPCASTPCQSPTPPTRPPWATCRYNRRRSGHRG